MKRAWLGGVMIGLALSAAAEVRQSLVYDYYDVRPRADESIADALSRVSPIRQGGRVFHGYTRWWVEWRFWWRETPNRRCRIDRVEVSVRGEIQLPELKAGSSNQRDRFLRYRDALHQHELGHYGFALRAGQEIDRGIANLPAEPTCRRLETVANDIGHGTLSHYRQLEDRYDRETDHGRTQGAWLGD